MPLFISDGHDADDSFIFYTEPRGKLIFNVHGEQFTIICRYIHTIQIFCFQNWGIVVTLCTVATVLLCFTRINARCCEMVAVCSYGLSVIICIDLLEMLERLTFGILSFASEFILFREAKRLV